MEDGATKRYEKHEGTFQKTRSADFFLQESVAKNEDAAARMSMPDTNAIPSRSEQATAEHKEALREGAECSRGKPEVRGALVTEAAAAAPATARDSRFGVSNSKPEIESAHSAREQKVAKGSPSTTRLTSPGPEETKKQGRFNQFKKNVKRLMTRRKEGGKEGVKGKGTSTVEKSKEKDGRTVTRTKEEASGGKTAEKNENVEDARSDEEDEVEQWTERSEAGEDDEYRDEETEAAAAKGRQGEKKAENEEEDEVARLERERREEETLRPEDEERRQDAGRRTRRKWRQLLRRALRDGGSARLLSFFFESGAVIGPEAGSARRGANQRQLFVKNWYAWTDAVRAAERMGETAELVQQTAWHVDEPDDGWSKGAQQVGDDGSEWSWCTRRRVWRERSYWPHEEEEYLARAAVR